MPPPTMATLTRRRWVALRGGAPPSRSEWPTVIPSSTKLPAIGRAAFLVRRTGAGAATTPAMNSRRVSAIPRLTIDGVELALVVAHEHLIVETIGLDRYRLHVARKGEHLRKVGGRQKPQSLRERRRR